MDCSIVAADEARMVEIEAWLDAEEAIYALANEEWEANEYDGPGPVRGFRCNWDSLKERWQQDGEVFVLTVQHEAVGFLERTNFLEIKPDWRGRGLGAELAKFMLQREYDAGRSVVDIGIAPSSAEPFWRDGMGFTVVRQRHWHGGGMFAYKVLNRIFELGAGTRAPYSVAFYSADEARSIDPVPFIRFDGIGERLADGGIQLPERAYCFNPDHTQFEDCFVAIELDGEALVFDKTRRSLSAKFGVQKDKGGIYFVDRILLGK